VKGKGERKIKLKVFVGIALTFLMASLVFSSLPVVKSSPATIQIGVIGPKGWIQWDGLWEAAQMAAYEINATGGILGAHPIQLIDIDEHAADFRPDLGIQEAIAALDGTKASCQFFVGGFRTECVIPIREAVMDFANATGRPIWFIAGSATDSIIDCGVGVCTKCVRCNYARYKYMFRVTPMNSTILFKQFAMFLRTYVILKKLAPMYGSYTGVTIPITPTHPYEEKVYAPKVKTYIVAENLAWADVMVKCLVGNVTYPFLYPGVPNPYPPPPSPYSVLGPNAIIVGEKRPSATATTTDLLPIFEGADGIDATGARLIIHIFSAIAGTNFITLYGTRQTDAVPVGINVESQMQEFWAAVFGKCEYESFLASVGTRTPIVPGKTDKFWDDYKAKWGHCPIYTAWGAYDSIIALNETIGAVGSWPLTCGQLIVPIETTDRTGLLGRFCYTGAAGNRHDVYCDVFCLTSRWPITNRYVRAQIPQWQAVIGGGEMKVCWPQDQPYSRKYRIPPWMYTWADWDLNFDGIIDIEDIYRCALAYGSVPGHERWDLESDVNTDGIVDIEDIYAIALRYGRMAPTWPLP